MDELLQAVRSIAEAKRWLEKGEGELADLIDLQFPEDQQMPGVMQALQQFPGVYKALKAILEPLATMTKAAEEYEAHLEKWNPN